MRKILLTGVLIYMGFSVANAVYSRMVPGQSTGLAEGGRAALSVQAPQSVQPPELSRETPDRVPLAAGSAASWLQMSKALTRGPDDVLKSALTLPNTPDFQQENGARFYLGYISPKSGKSGWVVYLDQDHYIPLTMAEALNLAQAAGQKNLPAVPNMSKSPDLGVVPIAVILLVVILSRFVFPQLVARLVRAGWSALLDQKNVKRRREQFVRTTAEMPVARTVSGPNGGRMRGTRFDRMPQTFGEPAHPASHPSVEMQPVRQKPSLFGFGQKLQRPEQQSITNTMRRGRLS